MDDTSRRTLALTIASNRNKAGGADVTTEAQALYDWMTARSEPGEQCVIAANNNVLAQASVQDVIDEATRMYAFQTNGDGSPVPPPSRVEMKAPVTATMPPAQGGAS